jgi:hypothetical protein
VLAVASHEHERAKEALKAKNSPLAQSERQTRAANESKSQAVVERARALAAAKSKARKKAKNAAKARKKRRR